MDTSFPMISSVGFFDSHQKFPDFTITPWRTVEEYELELFHQNGGASFIGGDVCPAKPGAILFARPGDVRRSQLHLSCHYVHFSTQNPDMAELLSGIPAYIPGNHTDEVLPILMELLQIFTSDGQYIQLALTEKLLKLLLTVNDIGRSLKSKTSLTEYGSEIVTEALCFMEQNYGEPITVSDIAKHCNISVPQFYRYFSLAVGEPPKSYLSSLRINHAKQLLLSTDLAIGAIAEKCGFSSHTNFCYSFREHEHLSPAEYKKAMRYHL